MRGRAATPPQGGERLQKLLSAAGVASRRQVEAWIRAGRVSVDGQPAQLGARAGPQADIRLDGRALPGWPPAPTNVRSGEAREVLVYHKPAGEVTTRSDPRGRPTVFERLPSPQHGRWVVVGRLDVNTTGLLLFTTDGELAHRLMHPSGRIEREYLVRVRGRPAAAVLQRLRGGVQLADGAARFERLEPVEASQTARAGSAAAGSHSWFRVMLREGRNREVRRLWQAVGCEVSRLMRVRYGPVRLPQALRAGQSRTLTPALVDALRSAVSRGPVGPER